MNTQLQEFIHNKSEFEQNEVLLQQGYSLDISGELILYGTSNENGQNMFAESQIHLPSFDIDQDSYRWQQLTQLCTVYNLPHPTGTDQIAELTYGVTVNPESKKYVFNRDLFTIMQEVDDETADKYLSNVSFSGGFEQDVTIEHPKNDPIQIKKGLIADEKRALVFRSLLGEARSTRIINGIAACSRELFPELGNKTICQFIEEHGEYGDYAATIACAEVLLQRSEYLSEHKEDVERRVQHLEEQGLEVREITQETRETMLVQTAFTAAELLQNGYEREASEAVSLSTRATKRMGWVQLTNTGLQSNELTVQYNMEASARIADTLQALWQNRPDIEKEHVLTGLLGMHNVADGEEILSQIEELRALKIEEINLDDLSHEVRAGILAVALTERVERSKKAMSGVLSDSEKGLEDTFSKQDTLFLLEQELNNRGLYFSALHPGEGQMHAVLHVNEETGFVEVTPCPENAHEMEADMFEDFLVVQQMRESTLGSQEDSQMYDYPQSDIDAFEWFDAPKIDEDISVPLVNVQSDAVIPVQEYSEKQQFLPELPFVSVPLPDPSPIPEVITGMEPVILVSTVVPSEASQKTAQVSAGEIKEPLPLKQNYVLLPRVNIIPLFVPQGVRLVLSERTQLDQPTLANSSLIGEPEDEVKTMQPITTEPIAQGSTFRLTEQSVQQERPQKTTKQVEDVKQAQATKQVQSDIHVQATSTGTGAETKTVIATGAAVASRVGITTGIVIATGSETEAKIKAETEKSSITVEESQTEQVTYTEQTAQTKHVLQISQKQNRQKFEKKYGTVQIHEQVEVEEKNIEHEITEYETEELSIQSEEIEAATIRLHEAANESKQYLTEAQIMESLIEEQQAPPVEAKEKKANETLVQEGSSIVVQAQEMYQTDPGTNERAVRNRNNKPSSVIKHLTTNFSQQSLQHVSHVHTQDAQAAVKATSHGPANSPTPTKAHSALEAPVLHSPFRLRRAPQQFRPTRTQSHSMALEYTPGIIVGAQRLQDSLTRACMEQGKPCKVLVAQAGRIAETAECDEAQIEAFVQASHSLFSRSVYASWKKLRGADGRLSKEHHLVIATGDRLRDARKRTSSISSITETQEGVWIM